MQQLKLFPDEIPIGSKVRVLSKSAGTPKLPFYSISKGDIMYVEHINKSERDRHLYFLCYVRWIKEPGAFLREDLEVIEYARS